MGYTEGAHDSPADTLNLLLRIGAKYLATAPAVADGDNVHLAVDAEGRLITTGPEAKTIQASVTKTATFNGADQTNRRHKGVILYLDISAASGTSPTLDVKLQGKDPISGLYVDIAGAAFAQKTGVGTSTLTLYPGIAESANVSVSDLLPRTWRYVATIAGTSPSFTYSISADQHA